MPPPHPAAHRYHQKAAQAVLKALLPEAGSDIKGSRQSYEALLEASGYAQRPSEFGDLIQILDSEIRLITPTVPAGEDVEYSRDTMVRRRPVDGLAEPAAQQEEVLPAHPRLSGARPCATGSRANRRRRDAGERSSSWPSGPALWNAKPENQQLPSLLRVCQHPHADPTRELDRAAAENDGACEPGTPATDGARRHPLSGRHRRRS